ncbi:transcriptional activator RinB [Staphylococcus delphini]|uniref:transcriptional activator RinB n=1 Tax=Staphylococcus delphini TaxID=53344 RepID=UPI0021CE8784|nr:hypothetical protein [Staphylococcus delphini]UXS21192.1 hypothetical protein MUA22_10215 [Staphylococcus delphini]
MTIYTCMHITPMSDEAVLPGKFINIKKLKHPIVTKSGKKYTHKTYLNGKAILLTKPYIKAHFKKGGFQNPMGKFLIKSIAAIVLYKTIKHFIEQAIVVLTANDDIDTFNECDHIHLNNLRAEVTD